MKDRLIELLRKKEDDFTITCPRYEEGATLINCIGCKYDMEDGSCDYASREADYLLENGVIVPPCNIGQTVYRIWCGEIEEYEVIEYRYDGQRLWFFSYNDEYALHQRSYIFAKNEIGKIVFLTREEAEAKLKEGVQK